MQLDDQAMIIEAADFFSVCTPEQKRLLAFSAEQRHYSAGDVVYQRDERSDGAYLVISGMVRLSGEGPRPPRGKVVETPDVLIGELGLFLDKPRRGTLKAVTDASLLFIPQSAFKKLLAQDPNLAQRTAQRLQGDLDAFLSDVSRVTPKIKS